MLIRHIQKCDHVLFLIFPEALWVTSSTSWYNAHKRKLVTVLISLLVCFSGAAGITFEELIVYVGISAEELNKPCSDEHITSISLFLGNWQTVAPLLGLTEADKEDIEEEGKNTQDKRYKTLRRWKDKNLFKGTYEVLVDVFLKLGKADLAEKVCRLLVGGGTYIISTALLLVLSMSVHLDPLISTICTMIAWFHFDPCRKHSD